MSSTKPLETICNDTRKCFAKRRNQYGLPICSVLTSGYANGECPFRKKDRNITNGKCYYKPVSFV